MGEIKKWVGISVCLVAAAGVFLRATAQMTPEQISERPAMEAFLTKAKIIGAENLGEGVTRPKKLTLKKDGLETCGVWKSPSGSGSGTYDKWECEIAAYRMDKLLGLNMVPPTVERSYRGRKGSLQLWIYGCSSELARVENDIPYPPEKAERIARMQYLHRAFDSLIGNADRTLQNMLWTEDWRLILIDHSRTFRCGSIHEERLMYGKSGLRGDLHFHELPRSFVERVRNLNFEQIRRAVEFYANYREIEAILKRRDILISEIDEMIAERGEAAVLY